MLAFAVNPPFPAFAIDIFGFKIFEKPEQAAPEKEAVRYRPSLRVEGGSENLREKFEANSLLISNAENPPLGTVGLIARARTDFERLVGTLYEEGYYAGTVQITVNGKPLEEVGVSETLNEPVDVSIGIEPGTSFIFGDIGVNASIDLREIKPILSVTGLSSGRPALSGHVLDTETALLQRLQNSGYPFAEIAPRTVAADHETNTLDVELTLKEGAKADFGPVSVKGTKRLKPDFVKRIADVPEGRPYSKAELEKARKRVAKLNAVGTVTAAAQRELTEDGGAPIVFEVSERKKRAVGVETAFSSVDGFGSTVFWEHRNLFGRAEKLRLEAGFAGVLDIVADNDAIGDDIDANVAVGFSQPGILDPYSTLDTQIFAKQESPESFTARSFGIQSVLSHEYSERLTVSSGLGVECIDVQDVLVNDTFCPLSAPLTLAYDGRDDKNEPTKGFAASAGATPSYDLRNTAAYASFNARFSAYRGFGQGPQNSRRLVLAGLGQIGSIAGADLTEIPANRRFLLGGAGSLRGFAFRNVGFTRIDGEAVGGLSFLSGSAEARIRLTDSFGAALFADAGAVGETSRFGGLDDLNVGIGAGIRYYTSIGAIRLDVAVPLDEQEGDDPVAFYIGIGQAF